jgi:hypothetical protein
MTRSTNLRRGASALGAAGLIALSLAGPASARPDPGVGNLHEGVGTRQDYTPSDSSPAAPSLPAVDGNPIEYVQLGAGLLAGLALAGAGMAVVSRRAHARAAHPV